MWTKPASYASSSSSFQNSLLDVFRNPQVPGTLSCSMGSLEIIGMELNHQLDYHCLRIKIYIYYATQKNRMINKNKNGHIPSPKSVKRCHFLPWVVWFGLISVVIGKDKKYCNNVNNKLHCDMTPLLYQYCWYPI